MTEEELKQKEEFLKEQQKNLDEAFLRYAMAENEAHDAKKLYDKWCVKMQRANFLAGVTLGISIAVLLYNLARLFL